MKNVFAWLGAVTLATAVAAPVAAQSQRGEAKLVVAGKTVKIEYGRPSLKGRDMLSRAEIGKPWRMGMNAATSLTTDAALSFGDVAVPAGSYVLTATRTAESSWQLDVASADKQTVIEVPLTAREIEQTVETFTIELAAESDGAVFRMAWGGTELSAPFRVQ